ncbi:MAG: hypothetical protein HW400_611 [Candidatus Levybacteria bacterium]|nr:hypothetical protein [Candidatus Levybacteria bacterium]
MVITRRQVELESVFLITATAAISLFFVIQRNNSYRPQFSLASNTSSLQIQTELIAPKVTISSQITPDGTKKVIMKVTENSDNTKTYEFSTADENGANEQYIFTKILDLTKSMTIPFNTWSPDNQYFFIQENAPDNKSVFVFKATGATFAEGVTFLDATDLFGKAATGNNFQEATGWASESLIIINTLKPDNTKGPSYWFEVPSKAIIQLSTEF